MTRSRRYLNNLPNADKIKILAGEILDCEIKLDNAVYNGKKLKKEFLFLENQLKTLDKNENPQKIETTNEKLKNLSNNLMVNEKEINNLTDRIHYLQSIVNEEIREGLSNMFHAEKSCSDDAQKNIIKYQKIAEEAQNKLSIVSGVELEKYHRQWILNVEKVIKYQEELEKCEKQLEAIKRVYKLEFG
jgi:hypothetical protein